MRTLIRSLVIAGLCAGLVFASVGSANTPPEQLGINQDSPSDQAKAARRRQPQAKSRVTSTTPHGQTYPSYGTFVPTINSGAGADGTTSGVSTGAGMATGTGAGSAASTNGSPTAH